MRKFLFLFVWFSLPYLLLFGEVNYDVFAIPRYVRPTDASKKQKYGQASTPGKIVRYVVHISDNCVICKTEAFRKELTIVKEAGWRFTKVNEDTPPDILIHNLSWCPDAEKQHNDIWAVGLPAVSKVVNGKTVGIEQWDHIRGFNKLADRED